MSYKLLTFFGNHLSNSIFVTADIAGVKIDAEYVTSQDLSKEDFKKKNPLGFVPVLQTASGCIYETSAILRLVARINKDKGLYGSNEYQTALVDQWLDFNNIELAPTLKAFIGPVLGWFPKNDDLKKESKSELKRLLQVLDEHLKLHTYVTGNSLTIADIAIIDSAYFLYKFLFVEKKRAKYPNLTRWFTLISSQAAFQKYYGKHVLAEKKFKPVKGAEHEGEKKEKKDDKKKDEKKKDEKKDEKKEEKKKDEKKKDDKKKKEEEEDDEPKEKQEKNPLDLLPPSTFNLFDFKTLIVNAPNKLEAIKFLWDNFDKEGFSIYYSKYIKDPSEGKVFDPYTKNLCNGTLERIDEKFRKHTIGVYGVYGDEPNLEIRGVWLWRGKDIPTYIKDLPNFEYHEWVKLDPSNAENRHLLEQYWNGMAENSVVEGLKTRHAKYYK